MCQIKGILKEIKDHNDFVNSDQNRDLVKELNKFLKGEIKDRKNAGEKKLSVEASEQLSVGSIRQKNISNDVLVMNKKPFTKSEKIVETPRTPKGNCEIEKNILKRFARSESVAFIPSGIKRLISLKHMNTANNSPYLQHNENLRLSNRSKK